MTRLLIAGVALWCGAAVELPAAQAAAGVVAPSKTASWPAPGQILRLWPGRAPGWVASTNVECIVKERHRNVSVPELWVYLPTTPAQHRVSVLLCPGGGYGHLALGPHLSHDVKLFNDQGIAVFGLKYRTRYGTNDVVNDAVTDCARAVRLIRRHAEEWGLDPARVGIQGYSAGANACLNLLGRFAAGASEASDPVEKYSSRPDFVALMCPWPNGKSAKTYPVLKDPPPVFIASARDDKTAPTAFALEIAETIKRQGGRVELFIVPTGGHGAFQYGVGNGPGTKWPDAFNTIIPR